MTTADPQELMGPCALLYWQVGAHPAGWHRVMQLQDKTIERFLHAEKW